MEAQNSWSTRLVRGGVRRRYRSLDGPTQNRQASYLHINTCRLGRENTYAEGDGCWTSEHAGCTGVAGTPICSRTRRRVTIDLVTHPIPAAFRFVLDPATGLEPSAFRRVQLERVRPPDGALESE